jgi:type VI secretion system protein ImpI
MTLTLHIENETSLPDGGPLSVSIKGKRGLDIGRDPYLDWTLPDPSRFISGRHCEVRWHDGAYWLHDISTNGTFINGAEGRLKAPHRLRNGDRFVIGQYVIAATLQEDEIAQPSEAAAPQRAMASEEDLWSAMPNAAAPIDPQQLKAPRASSSVRADFLDWAIDVPVPTRPAPPAPGPAAPSSVAPVTPVRSRSVASELEHDSWAAGPAPPPEPQPEIIPVPTPRRPDAADATPSWSAPEHVSPPVTASRAPVGNADGNADRHALANFAQLVARGAGLPDDAFAGREPAELAEQMGRVLKLATDNMKQLLEARQQAKRLARSPDQTTVQAVDNNPLKFAPTPEDALRTMFGPRSRGYLDAEKAFAQGFNDLKKHQVRTYAAMQQAIALLMKDVDPAAIEAASKADHGLAGLVGSRKARLWDTYVARWQVNAQRHDNGLFDTFMDYFARCYDGE